MKKTILEQIKENVASKGAETVSINIPVTEDNKSDVQEVLEGLEVEFTVEEDAFVLELDEEKADEVVKTIEEKFDEVKIDEACDTDKKDKKKDDKEDDKEDMDEAFKKAIEDVELDEKVVEELSTLFKASVEVRAKEIAEARVAEEMEAVEEEVAAIEERVATYLDYVAEEWMKENELKLEAGLKVEFAETFIEGMKELFDENYIDIPEAKVDVVAEMEKVNEALEEELDGMKNEVIALTKEINEAKAKSIVDEVSTDLTEIQKEKLSEMANSVEFVGEVDYKEKVTLLKTKYFTEDTNEPQDEEEPLDESVDRKKLYVQAIKRNNY